jgi:hypothetical protein
MWRPVLFLSWLQDAAGGWCVDCAGEWVRQGVRSKACTSSSRLLWLHHTASAALDALSCSAAPRCHEICQMILVCMQPCCSCVLSSRTRMCCCWLAAGHGWQWGLLPRCRHSHCHGQLHPQRPDSSSTQHRSTARSHARSRGRAAAAGECGWCCWRVGDASGAAAGVLWS